MDERKLNILQAIINDYIVSAEPVGSRTIAKKYDMGLSSATIRNEMADLEDMGYLEQPYTSAGRIPSDKAYRLYVDRLMKLKGLSTLEAKNIKAIYEQKTREIEMVIRHTAKILSDITTYTSLVLAPQVSNVLIRHIQLVQIDEQYALLVILTSAGIIKDTLIRIPKGIDSSYLYRISNMLTDKCKDKSLEEIDLNFLLEMEYTMSKERNFFNSLVDALTYDIGDKQQKDIYFGGTTNIFNFPEYHDILKAKAFLDLMEKKDLLYKLLKTSDSEGVSVVIGQENEYEELRDYSVITATYKIGEKTLGSFGIIGPTRMEYSKTVSVMDFVGKTLSDYLTKLFNYE